jgi:hypothetical protein
MVEKELRESGKQEAQDFVTLSRNAALYSF